MGKILLQGESLKTERIPKEKCDSAIDDFCDMHDCATKADDKFYAEEGLYGDNDAPIYRYFANWHEFKSNEYAEGVSLTSYNRLHSIFVQNPNIESVQDIDEFNLLGDPKAQGGLRIPGMNRNTLVDVQTWREWRENWYCEHQEFVEWNDWSKDFFVNKEVNAIIIRSEIRKYISHDKDIPSVECSDDMIDKIVESEARCHEDNDLLKPLAVNAQTLFFHRIVMASHARGGNRQGYLTEVGAKICKANYYIELPDLSAMEKEASSKGMDNTQRSIWGIKNNSGQWKFISFDFEKGMFEIHNDSGEHQGEFMFDGSKNSDVQEEHSLRCVSDWKVKRHLG